MARSVITLPRWSSVTGRHRIELVIAVLVVGTAIVGLILGPLAVFVGFASGILTSVAIVAWDHQPVPPEPIGPGDPRWCESCAGPCRDES